MVIDHTLKVQEIFWNQSFDGRSESLEKIKKVSIQSNHYSDGDYDNFDSIEGTLLYVWNAY